ncbi:molybdopterin molybdotransferase MoeA [Kordiimonas aquimaris]|uniref:molybdopterin molybdotransferase MoeA n=1 Tax=Kordiimonas aquimaris TaxID=707591 RepID=UPI0021D15847|nr:gephyrin-like molybdotransferase Glp [Kordiimonas aquimaris]
MISVEQAFARIVGDAKPLQTEKVAVENASGRVIASPVAARRSQPGTALSAMDGYAVNSAEIKGKDVSLKVTGESAAGHPFSGIVGSGETIRIFTGAAVPEGCDQVVIQENVERVDDIINTQEVSKPQNNVRPKGADFNERQVVLDSGTFMSPKSIGLAAAAGQSHLMVYRAPKIAILSTGDELASPDKALFNPYETVDSVKPQLSAMMKEIGAIVSFVGSAGDSPEALEVAIDAASDADILVTVGGASVGDKDFVQQALKNKGLILNFWKVAMRPGKPLIFGKRESQYVVGLPGNPASAFVCAILFLRPLVDKLMGRPAPLPSGVLLPTATALPANGPRQHYLRARLIGNAGERHVDAAASQDSSLQTVLAQCDGLIIRPMDAPAAQAGSLVPFIPF